MRISNDLARILAGAETLANEFIETEPDGPSYLNLPIYRRTDSDVAHHAGDIVGVGVNNCCLASANDELMIESQFFYRHSLFPAKGFAKQDSRE